MSKIHARHSQGCSWRESAPVSPLGEPRRIIRVLLGIGNTAAYLLAFSEADDLYEQAYQTAKATGHLMGMFDARYITLIQVRMLGQFDLGLSYSDELLALARKVNSRSREVVALMFIGLTQVYRGHFLTALERFQEAIAYRDKRQLPSEIGYYDFEGLPLVQLHAGHYETIPSSAEIEAWHKSDVGYLGGKRLNYLLLNSKESAGNWSRANDGTK